MTATEEHLKRWIAGGAAMLLIEVILIIAAVTALTVLGEPPVQFELL